MNIRTSAAILAGKAAAGASRALGRGGGTAVAGLVAERIDPAIVGTLRRAGGPRRNRDHGHQRQDHDRR